jgi:hypothetical protein
MVMRHRFGVALGILALVYFGQEASAAKVGPEFRVNTTKQNTQGAPKVAVLSNGGFVVAWTNIDFGFQGFDHYRTLAQRFTATGQRAGSEFPVGPIGEETGFPMAVIPLSTGGFIIIFDTGAGIRGQRYSGAGTLVGSQFVIAAANSAVGLSGGGFVVTYADAGAVYSQRYTTAGSPIGSAFLVNPAGSSDPHVAALSNGGFVVTWEWAGQDGSGYGIYGRRYDAAAAPAGMPFRANSHTTGNQTNPTTAGLTNGRFVVTWESNAQDGSLLGIYGQRYSAASTRVGGEFRINSFTPHDQLRPSITSLTDGGFVAVWMSDTQDGSDFGVYGKRYNSAGTPASNEFRVNTFTQGSQRWPSVAGFNNGGFVVVWESFNQDGIFGQRFMPD